MGVISNRKLIVTGDYQEIILISPENSLFIFFFIYKLFIIEGIYLYYLKDLFYYNFLIKEIIRKNIINDEISYLFLFSLRFHL